VRPAVTAVVLNYGHAEDTLRCVSSLGRSRYRNLSIVVVDNASPGDVTPRLRRMLDPAVTMLVTDTNLGYAGGNNVGITEARRRRADLVWLVNPDVVVEPRALSVLVDTAETRPDAGIIGSRMLYGGSDPAKIWFDGGIIDWSRGGATTHLHMGDLDQDVPARGPYPVDYVTGAGMLIRSDVFAEVGLLPEDYFLYFEETAYNLTVQRAGWATLVHAASRLWHHKRSTAALPQPYYVYYFIRNRIIFGTRFSSADADEIETDLGEFIAAWRLKVTVNAPSWVPVYDQLVSIGLEHGRAGRAGRWDGLAGFEAPVRAA
jgi:GT2 family glycosyltransferase